MEIRSSSSWSAAEIGDYLQSSVIPMRLAVTDADGAPVIFSLWYLFDGEHLWCATQRSAVAARRLRAASVCGFEIAGDQPPYRGVRGQGRAVVDADRGEEVLGRLIDRYLGSRRSDFARWLLSRGNREVAIRIEPHWLNAWDYSQRMRAINPTDS